MPTYTTEYVKDGKGKLSRKPVAGKADESGAKKSVSTTTASGSTKKED